MQINIVRTLSEWDSFSKEWNSLVENSASDVPFLRHEYLSTWWQTSGGGEWAQGDLYIATACQPDGSLVGAAPLFFTQNRDGEAAMMLLGSIEISDYLDVIAHQEHLEDFVNALLDHLAGPQAPDWALLDWYNLVDSSPTLPVIQAAAQARGWTCTIEPLEHCPYIPLPGDWEKYLGEQVDKKQRHEIRRKIRRAESNPEAVRWYIVDQETEIDSAIEAFLQLMAHDPAKERFLTDAMRAQMRLSLRAAFQAGWLQLCFLEIGSVKAAAYLNFDYNNRLWIYNSGLNFNHRELSPGWVLLGYLLQWANENGRESFDFMRGDEEYKYRFGAVDRRVMRVRVRRS